MLPGYIGDLILAATTIGTVSYLAYMLFFASAAGEGLSKEVDTSFDEDVPNDFVAANSNEEVDLTMGDVCGDMASGMAERDTDPGIAGLVPPET